MNESKGILHEMVTQEVCTELELIGREKEVYIVRDVLSLAMIAQCVGDHCITQESKRCKREISQFFSDCC